MTPIDAKQLAGWFEGLAPRLVLYARQWLDAGAAEDVVQETFARLMVQPAAPDSPRGWLYRSVRNAAIAQGRKRRARGRHLEQLARQSPALFESDPADLLDAAAVQQALQGLDEERHEVVVLKVWGDLALREIAEITGRPISTLSYQYRSALDDIRKKMGEPCRTKKN